MSPKSSQSKVFYEVEIKRCKSYRLFTNVEYSWEVYTYINTRLISGHHDTGSSRSLKGAKRAALKHISKTQAQIDEGLGFGVVFKGTETADKMKELLSNE
jgi:hypothetical protein